MRVAFHSLFAAAACALFVSCSTVGVQKQVVCRFAEFKEAGRLPGFAQSDRGDLKTQGLPFCHRITYPASVKIYATKENDSVRYTYTFAKESPSSEWRLTAAIRTTADGEREDLKLD